MRYEIPINGATWYADDPKPGNGLMVTVTVNDTAGALVHSDRLNLDKDKARTKFAEAAEIDARDLLTVRETLWEQLTAPPVEPDAEPMDPETEAAGLALLDTPDLLEDAARMVKEFGYAGATWLIKIVVLALVSRLLERPLNLVISGPSAAGKSFLVECVRKLFPLDATYMLSGMSDRVLAYTDADMRNRVLIIGEASALERDGIAAMLLRAVAWEGKLSYETVEKTPKGLQARRIEKPGPTGFITTTTKFVERELETRVLTVHVPDTQEVTRLILRTTAERSNGMQPGEPDVTVWHAAHTWLRQSGARDVTIPYAEQLSELIPADQVRWRRDFTQLLNLIKAHTVLYQRQRDRDGYGRIVATPGDYEAVYEIVEPVFRAIAAQGVTPAIREVVEAVKSLAETDYNSDGEQFTKPVSLAAVAQAIGLDKSTAYRRVSRALVGDWIVNQETRKRQPMKLVPGDDMPEDKPVLPSPENLSAYPPHNSATVQQYRSNPHADGENTIAYPDAIEADYCNSPDVLQQDMQQSFTDVDGENEDVLRYCTVAEGDSNTFFERTRHLLQCGYLDTLGTVTMPDGTPCKKPKETAERLLRMATEGEQREYGQRKLSELLDAIEATMGVAR